MLESDVLPSGRSDRILFFRGEAQEFEHPATASLFRWAFTAGGFCHQGCSRSQLTSDIYSNLNSYEPPVGITNFNSITRQWSDGLGRALPPVNNSRSKLQMLVTAHIMNSWEHLIDYDAATGKAAGRYDPFISFSLDPREAGGFAGLGVVYVASIPMDRLVTVASDDCGKDLDLTEMNIYDFTACLSGPDGKMGIEQEVDAYLYLPGLYSAFVVTVQAARRD